MSQSSIQIDNTELLENFIFEMEAFTFEQLEAESLQIFHQKDLTIGLSILESGMFSHKIKGSEALYIDRLTLKFVISSFEIHMHLEENQDYGGINIYITSPSNKTPPNSSVTALRYILWAVTHIDIIENHLNLSTTVLNKINKIHRDLYKVCHLEKVDINNLPDLTKVFMTQQVSKTDFKWLEQEINCGGPVASSYHETVRLPAIESCHSKRIVNPQARQLEISEAIHSNSFYSQMEKESFSSYFKVLYYFSDNTIIDADDILYHNNSIKIAPEFLPAGPAQLKKISSFWPEGSRWDNAPKKRAPFAELVIRILTTSNQPIPLSLALHTDGKKHLVFKTHQLGFAHSTNVSPPTPKKNALKSRLLKPLKKTLAHSLTVSRETLNNSEGSAISSLDILPQKESELYSRILFFNPIKVTCISIPFEQLVLNLRILFQLIIDQPNTEK